MEQPGMLCLLLVLLVLRAAAQQCLDQRVPNRPVKEGGPADKARAYTLEWRMEAVAHVASLSIRNQQCKTDPSNCDLQEGAAAPISLLAEWAVHNSGWERLLSSASLYEIARQAYQAGDHDEAIIALEEALALRLFPYQDSAPLDRWQQGLMLPGGLFRRQKMDLANILVLRSDCLVQLAQAQQDIDDISEAMELLQLATALLKAGNELVPDSLAALQHRAQTLASVAMKILPQLRRQRILEHLQGYGLTCPSCRTQMDYLAQMVPLLRIPLRVVNNQLEVITDPFRTQMGALLRQPHETVGGYMQRVFFRLLAMVPSDYLADLKVPCRKTDAKGRCLSYLPAWVTAQNGVNAQGDAWGALGGHSGGTPGSLQPPPGVSCGAPGQPTCAWGSFDVGAGGPSMAGPLGSFDINSGRSVAGGKCTDQLCGGLAGGSSSAGALGGSRGGLSSLSQQPGAEGSHTPSSSSSSPELSGSSKAGDGDGSSSGGGTSSSSSSGGGGGTRKRGRRGSRGRGEAGGGGAAAAASAAGAASSGVVASGGVAGSGGGFTPEGSVTLAGSQLCGFLHVRAIPPGVDLPASGGNLTPEQQRLLQQKARDGAAAGGSAPFQGVYYYYYADIPALVDRVVNTFDQEESEYLFAQLDGLTGVHWLSGGGRGRGIAQGHLSCTETELLEGRAPLGCSVLVPNFGSCATTPLKPPRRRIPLPPPPPGLGLPPPLGTYTPKLRQRMPADFQWTARSSNSVSAAAAAAAGVGGGGYDGGGAAAAGGGARAGVPRGVPQGSGGPGGGGQQGSNQQQTPAWERMYYSTSDRELSDRQLQEQMRKMRKDATREDRDDPLIPLTLACIFASFCLYVASRRRKSLGGLVWSGAHGRAGAGAGHSTLGSGDRSSGRSEGDAHGASGAGAVSSSTLRRQVAAALRDAMVGGDVAKLEAAVAEAESLELDAALIQRARVTLAQRKKREKERAALAAAKARALKKEQTRRQKAAAAAAAAAAAEAAAAAAAKGAGAREGYGAGRGGPFQRLMRWWACGAGSMPQEDDSALLTQQGLTSSSAGAQSGTEPGSPTAVSASGGSAGPDTLIPRDCRGSRRRAAAAAAAGGSGRPGGGGAVPVSGESMVNPLTGQTNRHGGSSNSLAASSGTFNRASSAGTPDGSAVVHLVGDFGDLVQSPSAVSLNSRSLTGVDSGQLALDSMLPSGGSSSSSSGGSGSSSSRSLSSGSSSGRDSSDSLLAMDAHPTRHAPPAAATPAAAAAAGRPTASATSSSGAVRGAIPVAPRAGAVAPPAATTSSRAKPSKPNSSSSSSSSVSSAAGSSTSSRAGSSSSSGIGAARPTAAASVAKPSNMARGGPTRSTAAAAGGNSTSVLSPRAAGNPLSPRQGTAVPPPPPPGRPSAAAAPAATPSAAAAAAAAAGHTRSNSGSNWLGWLSQGASSMSSPSKGVGVSPAKHPASPVTPATVLPVKRISAVAAAAAAAAAAGGNGGTGGAVGVGGGIGGTGSGDLAPATPPNVEQGTPGKSAGRLNPSAAPFEPPRGLAPVATTHGSSAGRGASSLAPSSLGDAYSHQEQAYSQQEPPEPRSPLGVILPDSLYPSSCSPELRPLAPPPAAAAGHHSPPAPLQLPSAAQQQQQQPGHMGHALLTGGPRSGGSMGHLASPGGVTPQVTPLSSGSGGFYARGSPTSGHSSVLLPGPALNHALLQHQQEQEQQQLLLRGPRVGGGGSARQVLDYSLPGGYGAGQHGGAGGLLPLPSTQGLLVGGGGGSGLPPVMPPFSGGTGNVGGSHLADPSAAAAAGSGGSGGASGGAGGGGGYGGFSLFAASAPLPGSATAGSSAASTPLPDLNLNLSSNPSMGGRLSSMGSGGSGFSAAAAAGVQGNSAGGPPLGALDRLPSYLSQLGGSSAGGSSHGSSMGLGGTTLPLLSSTQPLVSMFGASPHVWAPPSAVTSAAPGGVTSGVTRPVTAGVAGVSSLWGVPSDSSSPLGPHAGAHVGHRHASPAASIGQDLQVNPLDSFDQDVAAAALSQGVAEQVLGTSPSLVVKAEADMLQLAHKMMSQVMD